MGHPLTAGGKKQRKVLTRALAMASLVELGETMKTILEGIQFLGAKMEEWRKVDVACYWVLTDIWRSMQDLVWKSALETRSGTESMEGSQELLELLKEKEESTKKVSEMEVLGVLFLLDEVDQILQ